MYKPYRKKTVQMMRPYVPGESMEGVSVNKEDEAEVASQRWGGMIAINMANLEDRWYVSKKFFETNYEEVT